MKDFFFQKSIERLERAGNNDYGLLIEFGADAYSTEELNALLQKISVEKDIVRTWQEKADILVVAIFIWLAAAFVTTSFGYLFWTFVFLAAMATSVIIGIVVYLSLYRQYPYINNYKEVFFIIENELDKRRHDKLIFYNYN